MSEERLHFDGAGPAFLPTLDTMPRFPRLSGSAKVGVLSHPSPTTLLDWAIRLKESWEGQIRWARSIVRFRWNEKSYFFELVLISDLKQCPSGVFRSNDGRKHLERNIRILKNLSVRIFHFKCVTRMADCLD